MQPVGEDDTMGRIGVCVALGLTLVGIAGADDPEIARLKAEVERLQSENKALKSDAEVRAGLALLGLAAVGIFVASEWTYISRMRSHPANSILDVAWYEPKEAVPGAQHPVPLPVADGIAPDAFAEAVKLAESKNASALLVVHEGRVVLDRHWRGHRPDDWTNSA